LLRREVSGGSPHGHEPFPSVSRGWRSTRGGRRAVGGGMPGVRAVEGGGGALPVRAAPLRSRLLLARFRFVPFRRLALCFRRFTLLSRFTLPFRRFARLLRPGSLFLLGRGGGGFLAEGCQAGQGDLAGAALEGEEGADPGEDLVFRLRPHGGEAQDG